MDTKVELPTQNNDPDLEKQITAFYSSYKAEPSFKQNLQNQLRRETSREAAKTAGGEFFGKILPSPTLRWVVGVLVFVLVCALSLTIAPVRNAIGNALDVGYIDGVGFVKISETYVLSGKTISDRLSRSVVIDQVVMNSDGTRVWFHSAGELSPTLSDKDGPIASMEVEDQIYPTRVSGWVDDSQRGIIEFSASTPSPSLTVVLHIEPNWVIPIQLIPMRERSDELAVTTFSDQCQIHQGVELCVQAFVSDSTGYHLLLNASSSNPDFYLETPFLSNRLTGEDAQLTDSSGNLLQKSSSSSPNFPMPFEIPVEVFDSQRKVSTTLNYSPSTQEGDFLTLTIPGLTVKTPANQTITCNLENDLTIGSTFPCKASVTIGGNELTFHSGEVLQGQTGIQLRITGDPVYPVDNLILTGVNFEVTDGNAPLIGTSFEIKTQQLSLFLERDTVSSDQPFSIQITAGYLTITEPYQFTWTINP